MKKNTIESYLPFFKEKFNDTEYEELLKKQGLTSHGLKYIKENFDRFTHILDNRKIIFLFRTKGSGKNPQYFLENYLHFLNELNLHPNDFADLLSSSAGIVLAKNLKQDFSFFSQYYTLDDLLKLKNTLHGLVYLKKAFLNELHLIFKPKDLLTIAMTNNLQFLIENINALKNDFSNKELKTIFSKHKNLNIIKDLWLKHIKILKDAIQTVKEKGYVCNISCFFSPTNYKKLQCFLEPLNKDALHTFLISSSKKKSIQNKKQKEKQNPNVEDASLRFFKPPKRQRVQNDYEVKDELLALCIGDDNLAQLYILGEQITPS